MCSIKRNLATALLVLTATCGTARALVVHGNLLSNPGFENGLTDWNTVSAETYWFVDRDFSPNDQGVGAAAIAATSSADEPISQCVRVTPGSTYLFSAWATAFCTGDAELTISWTSNDCSTRLSEVESSASTIVGDWGRLEISAIAPKGVTAAQANLLKENACNNVVFFDDASFTQDTILKNDFELDGEFL